MKIIDAHAHVYEHLTGYGARGEFRPLGHGRGRWATGEEEQFFPEKYGDTGFSAETLLGIMEENGVERAVLLQGGNYGFHNDYAAECAKKYPDRFTAVGTLDPYALYAGDILENLISRLGVRALKFEISQTWGMTGYHPGLRLDDPQFLALFERAQQEDMTVALDIGPMGTASFAIDPIRHVMAQFPRLRLVMTHLFFPCADGRNPERLALARELNRENFFFDISNLPPWVQEAYPFPSQQAFLREVRAVTGAEKLLWGTDVPSVLNRYPYARLIRYITEANIFTGAELERVFYQNARELYRMDG